MRGTVEEVGIAEGDVLGSGGYLATNVFQHNLSRNNSKSPVVHGHHRTMPAKMLTPTAGLGVSANAMPVRAQVQMSVARQLGQSGTVWNAEVEAIERNRLQLQIADCRLRILDKSQKAGFELAA